MRCLIVDDERLAREELRFLLSRHAAVEIAGEAATVRQALDLTTQKQPDVVLLDVQLHGETGFDFVDRVPNPRPHIIFVTAYDQHAVRGFECRALDYLLKPVRPDRLADALDRARRPSPMPRSQARVDDMVLLRIGSTSRFIPWRNILHVEAAGDYTRVFLDDGTEGLVLRPLKEWLLLAPSELLVRSHRSHLVRIDAIREVRLAAKDRRTLLLDGGFVVPIGRDFWPAIKALVCP